MSRAPPVESSAAWLSLSLLQWERNGCQRILVVQDQESQPLTKRKSCLPQYSFDYLRLVRGPKGTRSLLRHQVAEERQGFVGVCHICHHHHRCRHHRHRRRHHQTGSPFRDSEDRVLTMISSNEASEVYGTCPRSHQSEAGFEVTPENSKLNAFTLLSCA